LPRGAQHEQYGLAIGSASQQGGPTGGSTLLLEWTQALSENWAPQVVASSTVDDLMETLLLLETSVDREWLAPWFQHTKKQLLPFSRLYRSNSCASIALRLFQLDQAITYEKVGSRHSRRSAAQRAVSYNEDTALRDLDVPPSMHTFASSHGSSNRGRKSKMGHIEVVYGPGPPVFADPPDVQLAKERREKQRLAVLAAKQAAQGSDEAASPLAGTPTQNHAVSNVVVSKQRSVVNPHALNPPQENEEDDEEDAALEEDDEDAEDDSEDEYVDQDDPGDKDYLENEDQEALEESGSGTQEGPEEDEESDADLQSDQALSEKEDADKVEGMEEDDIAATNPQPATLLTKRKEPDDEAGDEGQGPETKRPATEFGGFGGFQ